jgi:hypothetical protein
LLVFAKLANSKKQYAIFIIIFIDKMYESVKKYYKDSLVMLEEFIEEYSVDFR